MAGIRVTDSFRRPKKAKQVTGARPKLSKLAELKKVNKQIDAERKVENKRFQRMDKLHTKSRKIREQLGID
jgi:hypothetical protein